MKKKVIEISSLANPWSSTPLFIHFFFQQSAWTVSPFKQKQITTVTYDEELNIQHLSLARLNITCMKVTLTIQN